MTYVYTWCGFAAGAAVYGFSFGFSNPSESFAGLYFAGAALFAHWLLWRKK